MDEINIMLDHGITLVDAEYGHSGVAAIYLLKQGGEVAIIETGTSHSVPYVEAALIAQNLSFDDVAYIIPTHVHLDHAGGAGELMHHCKKAKLIVHPFGAAHLVDPYKLIAGTKAVYGEKKFQKLYGDIRPTDISRVIKAPDLFSLNFHGRELVFYDTPGHARHHFCIYDKQSRGIFTGDTFGVSYPQITTQQGPFIFATTTPVQFDPGALLQSIEHLMALKPKVLYLTHFGPITPKSDIIKQLTQSIREFSNIALDVNIELGSQEDEENHDNRIRLIQQKISHYLLNVLGEMGAKQDQKTLKQAIKLDTLLNAQGLNFWLTKNKKI